MSTHANLHAGVSATALDGKSTPPTEGITRATGLWTSKDVACHAQCSLRQVGYWRQEGLPCLKLGQMVRFEPHRVLAWLRRHEQGSCASISGTAGQESQ